MISIGMKRAANLWAAVALTILALPAQAAALSGPALAKALQGGGYVIVMRHASSPGAPPTAAEADPANPRRERQLDEAGRTSASAMGAAIKALHIRVGEVWSSPTYRALETARLAGLPEPKIAVELGDHGQNMQAADSGQASWLKAKAAAPPRRRADTIIVTHYPNIMAAFGPAATGLSDGEGLVFQPVGKGAAILVGRIKIDEWPTLARP